jgi:hypothetical protein
VNLFYFDRCIGGIFYYFNNEQTDAHLIDSFCYTVLYHSCAIQKFDFLLYSVFAAVLVFLRCLLFALTLMLMYFGVICLVLHTFLNQMAPFVFSKFSLVFFIIVAEFCLLGLYYFNLCTVHFSLYVQ